MGQSRLRGVRGDGVRGYKGLSQVNAAGNKTMVPGTEHVLMEGALTALALSPQARETLL